MPAEHRRWVVPAIAAASLIAGFGVADVTGLRWLGAIVLVLGGVWCAVQMWRPCGAAATIAVGVSYLAAFVLSHPVGRLIGSWAAVVVLAALVAVFAYVVIRPTGSRDSTTPPSTNSTR